MLVLGEVALDPVVRTRVNIVFQLITEASVWNTELTIEYTKKVTNSATDTGLCRIWWRASSDLNRFPLHRCDRVRGYQQSPRDEWPDGRES